MGSFVQLYLVVGHVFYTAVYSLVCYEPRHAKRYLKAIDLLRI